MSGRWVKLAAGVGLALSAFHLYRRRNENLELVSPELRGPASWFCWPSLGNPIARLIKRLTDLVPTCALDNVSRERHSALSQDDNEVPFYLYRPVVLKGDGILLYIHGGGFATGSTARSNSAVSGFADILGVLAISVDYRLAPQHPYPAALNDIYAVFVWIVDHAIELGIDKHKIAVCGGNSGGTLAASLASRALDEGPVLPIVQVLEYAMLDDVTPLPQPGRGDLIWTRESDIWSWNVYLRSGGGRWAIPAKRQDLCGLPPAWIGIASLDLLAPQQKEYAQRLRAAGVPVQVSVASGAYHGFDMAYTAPAIVFVCLMIDAIAAAFEGDLSKFTTVPEDGITDI